MVILGLDMSSTCLGYATIVQARPDVVGHVDLRGDIAARCLAARRAVADLLTQHMPTLVVIESPVAKFAKAVLPQARVSGAVLCLLAEQQALWCEVTPGVAKRALTGDGGASKLQMVEAAAERLGLVGAAVIWRGKTILRAAGGAQLLTEDEADALGLALAGLAVRVEPCLRVA